MPGEDDGDCEAAATDARKRTSKQGVDVAVLVSLNGNSLLQHPSNKDSGAKR